MRALYDSWEKHAADADAQQAKISALRTAVQAYPVIPLLKPLTRDAGFPERLPQSAS